MMVLLKLNEMYIEYEVRKVGNRLTVRNTRDILYPPKPEFNMYQNIFIVQLYMKTDVVNKSKISFCILGYCLVLFVRGKQYCVRGVGGWLV